MKKDIAFPYQFDHRGRTAESSVTEHVRQLIEQILFTNPGERVNRPEFGSGVNRLVFAPASEELQTATEFMIQGAIQQWLSELILVESVRVESNDSQLLVTIVYIIRRDQRREVVTLEGPGGTP